MTDTLRDKLIQKGWVTPFKVDTLVRLIEEHYADEPAVPEGREPASVAMQPSDKELLEKGPSLEEVEELCEEHCFNVEGYESLECLQGLINDALARWGNLKGSLTSSPPADGEVAELVADLRGTARGLKSQSYPQTAELITRAAELLQRQALVPVSVSERLPGAEDCDAEGRCWWWDGEWGLIEQRFTDYIVTHWLPAHALPLPEVNNG